jgi:hypothetical protein
MQITVGQEYHHSSGAFALRVVPGYGTGGRDTHRGLQLEVNLYEGAGWEHYAEHGTIAQASAEVAKILATGRPPVTQSGAAQQQVGATVYFADGATLTHYR